MEIKACKIVTIKEIVPLFKGEEQANAIELALFEEIGNTVVVGKDFYKQGDKALFIQPDYCLSYIPLFQEYFAPGGDPKKCKLGGNNRIKAIKFNLHSGDNQPTYSYGILIQKQLVSEILNLELIEDFDWDTKLGITKYEEPEPTQKGNQGVACPFPDNMYKTDEENINNLVNDIQFPINLILTEKIDGSSITIWYKNGKSGIASRKLGRPLVYEKVVGFKKPNFFHKLFTKITFGKYKYFGKKIMRQTENDDNFVIRGKPYLEKLNKYGKNIALRGELVGKGCKGSGNRNNPKAREDTHIEFFCIDDYNDHTKKFNYTEIENIAKELDLQLVKKYCQKDFESLEELRKYCNEIFAEEKSKGRLIEGVVARTEDSSMSFKIMSMDYDLKK